MFGPNRLIQHTVVAISLALGLVGCTQQDTDGNAYLISPGFPNSIHIFDAEKLVHVREIELPGDPSPSTAALSPDGKRIFVVTGRSQSVVGIDLPSGETIFRADLSSGNERVTTFPSVVVSADGERLYVYQFPVTLLPAEYRALEPRFAVYNIADGIGAEPIRTFPAPIKVFLLLPSPKGDIFHAFGDSLFTFDGATGKQIGDTKTRSWNRDGFVDADYFPYWIQGSRTVGEFRLPYYSERTNENGEREFAFGLFGVDLETGAVEFDDLSDADPEVTHAWLDPTDDRIAYTVGTRLNRINLETGTQTAQIKLDRAYKQAISSPDGARIFIGGGLDYISVYESDSFEYIGRMDLPKGADQGNGFLHLTRW